MLDAGGRVGLLRDAAAVSGLRVFVETGSSTGDTTAALLDQFDRLYTIELDGPSYRACVRRFAGEPRVLPIHGDSAVILQELAPLIAGPAVWWLDAHANEGHEQGPVVCPTLDELRHILGPWPDDNWVLIDDAHLFGVEPGYPSVYDVEMVVRSYGSRYNVDVADNVIRLTPVQA